jgi:predicted amidophosphoribosyltransferase
MNGYIAIKHILICSHCGQGLVTKKEEDEGLCSCCFEKYEEEMYAIYGDERGKEK